LGYEDNKFINAYNRSIGFTNEEAINSNLVSNVVMNLMNTQAVWIGKLSKLRLELNEFASKRSDLQGIVRDRVAKD
jgi:hypothetical protein